MLRPVILLAAAGVMLAAQDSGDKVTIPFRDPSGAKTLKVSLQNGSVTVKGYDGKDAQIDTTSRISGRERRPSHVPEGMHRIDNFGVGLDVTEENNTITVIGTELGGARDDSGSGADQPGAAVGERGNDYGGEYLGIDRREPH